MKKIIALTCSILASGFCLTAMADGAVMTGSPAMQSDKVAKHAACKPIYEACKSAGYSKGGAAGKSLRDCMKPLMQGDSVAGVSVTPDQIAACKASHKEHMMQHDREGASQ